MRQSNKWLLLLMTALLCTGCRDDSSVATTQTTHTTTQTVETTTTISTTQTISSSTSTTESPTQTTTPAPQTTVSTTSRTYLQGGQGGQEAGSDPAPIHFIYRFGTNSITARLAGGNYQTIPYDLTEAITHDLDSLYRLEDANFDGSLDLVVPVAFANANVRYAIFLWNAQTLQFSEQAIELVNPTVQPDTKTIDTVARQSASETCYETYHWDNGQLRIVTQTVAQFASLSTKVIHYHPDGSVDTIDQDTYPSLEALEAALPNT